MMLKPSRNTFLVNAQAAIATKLKHRKPVIIQKCFAEAIAGVDILKNLARRLIRFKGINCAANPRPDHPIVIAGNAFNSRFNKFGYRQGPVGFASDQNDKTLGIHAIAPAVGLDSPSIEPAGASSNAAPAEIINGLDNDPDRFEGGSCVSGEVLPKIAA